MDRCFESVVQICSNHVHRYKLFAGKVLTWQQVLEGWAERADFRDAFNQLLAESPFPAFRWETPGITSSQLESKFEFVLCQATRLLVPADPQPFAEHFVEPGGGEPRDHGVVCFDNLARTTWLIVPSPRGEFAAYGHLAAFCRLAPAAQRDALWRIVAKQSQRWLATRTLWLNTHGGAVDWLHVRLDPTPKYYGYDDYRLGRP